jgi:glycerophosphoryl diester phosphodiesterase
MRSSRSNPDPLNPGCQGFAHRGLHGPGVPENSLAAFDAAVRYGAGIECDVRLSGDGEVMVFHDHDLRRLCASGLAVEATAAKVLAGQRLHDSGEHIPWLGELLDLVRGRVPILIELKCRGGNVARLAEAVAGEIGGYAGPVGVMSYEPKVGRWFARHRPYIRRGLVVSQRAPAWDRWTGIGVASPHFIAAQAGLLGGRWADRVRSKKWLYSWTIATAAERAQAEVHADALIWEGDGRPRS